MMNDQDKQRFEKLHDRFKQKFGTGHIVKMLALILGILFFLVGVILLFLPGPGLLFIILGLGMMSLLSKKMAHNLDELELKIRTWIAKRRNRR